MAKLSLIPKVHKATHRIDVYLGELGMPITQGEAHVLAHLAEHGDSTINHIHHAFGHRRSTLTSIIDRLERGGLVERALNPADRRMLLVRATRAGTRLARQVHQALVRFERTCLAAASRRDLDAAAAVLDALGNDDGSPAITATAPRRARRR